MAWPWAHDPQNPAATPDYDEWGWDNWWSPRDWMTWHGAMKAAYGAAEAKNRWANAWQLQELGAGPIGARSFNSDFRAWAKAENLTDVLYWSAGVIAKPLGVANDVVDTASKVVDDGLAAAEEASGVIVWAVKHPFLTAGGALLGLGLLAVVASKVKGNALAAAVAAGMGKVG